MIVYRQRISDLQSAAASKTVVATGKGDSLCTAAAMAAPPLGTVFVDGVDAARIISQHAGPSIRLDVPASHGLSIENDNDPSHCPAFALYQHMPRGRVPVGLPPGTGAFCGNIPIRDWPNFALAEINGVPALFEGSGSSFKLTPRIASGWGTACSVSFKVSTSFAVAQSYCTGPYCSALQKMAIGLTGIVDGPAGLSTLWFGAIDPRDAARWKLMYDIWIRTLIHSSLPTFGKGSLQTPDYIDSQNGDLPFRFKDAVIPQGDNAFVPVDIQNELLLAKVGASGFGGANYTGQELFSFYKLAEETLVQRAGAKLVPIAGMIVAPSGYQLVRVDAKWVLPPTPTLPDPPGSLPRN